MVKFALVTSEGTPGAHNDIVSRMTTVEASPYALLAYAHVTFLTSRAY